MLTRDVWRQIGVLVGLALLLRLAWLCLNRPVPISDFADYYRLARDLLDHGQLGYPAPTLARLPGFPFVLSCAMVVSKSPLWLGVVTSVLSSGLVVLVYLFALQLTRQPAIARLAAGLCAVSPTFVCSASLLASEHAQVPLTLGALLLALEFRRRQESNESRWYALVSAAGVLLGAAMLTRGDALFYVPVVLMLVTGLPKRRLGRGALAGALLLVSIAAVVLPWYQRNTAIDAQAGLSTTSGTNFHLAHNASGYGRLGDKAVFTGLSQVERDRKGWDLGWQYIRTTHVVGLLRSTALGTAYLWGEPPMYAVKWSTVDDDNAAQKRWDTRLAYRAPGYALASAFYYILLVLGCVAWRYRKQLSEPAFAAACGLIFMNWLCYAVIFWGKARYRYLVEVLLCVFASISVYEMILPVARRYVRRRARE